jgi:hypothetical protein
VDLADRWVDSHPRADHRWPGRLASPRVGASSLRPDLVWSDMTISLTACPLCTDRQLRTAPDARSAQLQMPVVGTKITCSGGVCSGILGSMKRLERLVVHVEEGVRLGAMSDEAHLRLSLILLDSGIELMMDRQCDWLLVHTEAYDGLRRVQARYMATSEDADRIAELQEETVSNTQRKKIEHDFDAKCDYLKQHSLLADPQVRILKKLHKYRTEIYHRDQLRPLTLASAVKIYIYLACAMMRDLPMNVMSYSLDPLVGLVRYLTEDEHENLFRIGHDLPGRIAACLLSESGLAQPTLLGEALSQHALGRLDAIIEAAEECSDFFSQIGEGGWDVEAILAIAQTNLSERTRFVSPNEARALSAPVRVEQIEEWRSIAAGLAEQADDLATFAAFADLEDAFGPVEAQVMELAMEVGNEIQLQIDISYEE